MNRVLRSFYKRLGVIHLGRRRVRDLVDFIEDRKIDLVIDVGANVGQFGDSLREDGYRGRIVSFEPIRAVYETLAAKAAKDGNWEAHHCGMGAEAGTAELHVSGLSVYSSIQNLTSAAKEHDSRMAVDHVEQIEIRTLDEVMEGMQGKTLLKIDTQGYERQVLEGGRKTLPRMLGIMLELPVIHVYEGDWQFHESLKFMADLGFVPAQIQPVSFFGKDNASAVEFDCLFRPGGPADGVRSPAAQ